MKYLIPILILVFLISCEDSEKKENTELNKIVKAVISDNKFYDNKEIFIIDSLRQLVIYVPAKDEIEQKYSYPQSLDSKS